MKLYLLLEKLMKMSNRKQRDKIFYQKNKVNCYFFYNGVQIIDRCFSGIEEPKFSESVANFDHYEILADNWVFFEGSRLEADEFIFNRYIKNFKKEQTRKEIERNWIRKK